MGNPSQMNVASDDDDVTCLDSQAVQDQQALLGNLINLSSASDGVIADMEDFIQRYLTASKQDYATFEKLFVEKEMSTIFLGRKHLYRLRNYVYELMFIVSSYCFPPNDYQTRICGFYLLRAIYFLQPDKCNVRIRLSLERTDMLYRFIKRLRNERKKEAFYCVLSLVRARAFLFCKFTCEYNMLSASRLPMRTCAVVDEKPSVTSKEAFLIDNVISSKLIDTAQCLQDALIRLLDDPQIKQRIRVVPEELRVRIKDRMANYAADAKKSLDKLLNNEESVQHEASEEESLSTRRQELKQRAYSTVAVRSSSHRLLEQSAAADDDENSNTSVEAVDGTVPRKSERPNKGRFLKLAIQAEADDFEELRAIHDNKKKKLRRPKRKESSDHYSVAEVPDSATAVEQKKKRSQRKKKQLPTAVDDDQVDDALFPGLAVAGTSAAAAAADNASIAPKPKAPPKRRGRRRIHEIYPDMVDD